MSSPASNGAGVAVVAPRGTLETATPELRHYPVDGEWHLQQAWRVVETEFGRGIVESRIEWRDVPYVKAE